VFDTRTQLENGSFRATRWPSTQIRSAGRGTGGVTWFAGRGGIYTYTGYDDAYYEDFDSANELIVAPIYLKYYMHPQNFGDASTLKFPKQVDVTAIGSTDLRLCVFWAYDYSETYKTLCKTRQGGLGYQYNIDEYDDAQYTGAGNELSQERYNIWGSGRNIKLGFEATVSETQLSIQELNIQALGGRIL
jgi:hypothetical protein